MRFFRGLLAESILCGSRTVQVPQSRRKYVPVGLVPPSMAAQLCSTCTSLLRTGFRVVGMVLVSRLTVIARNAATRQFFDLRENTPLPLTTGAIL